MLLKDILVNPLKSFLQTLSVAINIPEVVGGLGLSCASQELGSFKTQMMVATLTPIILSLCIMASFVVRVVVLKHDRTLASRSHGFAVLLLFYLTLPSTSITIFQAFLCDSRPLGENGEGYLVADYAVNCEDTEYTNVILPIGIVAALVFPVGVNLLYMTILFRHRAEIHSEKNESVSSSAVSFLHKPFTQDCFWWEAVDSVRISVSACMCVVPK